MKILLKLFLLTVAFPVVLFASIFSDREESQHAWETSPEIHWIDGSPSFDAAKAFGNTFNFEASANFIDTAKFTSPIEVSREHFFYSGYDLSLSYSFFVNSCDALTFGVTYCEDRFEWKENHFFSQKNFSRVDFEFYGITYRMPNWVWRSGLAGSFDVDHWDDPVDYALCKYNLWGRYSYGLDFLPDLGLHIGITGRSGIAKEWLQPILGVDFSLCERWMVHLIYPVDLSIAYQWTDCFFVDLAYRNWNRRYRVDKDAILTKGIFEYRNHGLELGGHLKYREYFHAGLYLGHTFHPAELVIHDMHNQNEDHFRLKSSFYMGGELVLCF